MRPKTMQQSQLVLLIVVGFIVGVTNRAIAGTETTLHSFVAQAHGASPEGGLISDSAGNFYGVSGTGGAYDYGTVFELLSNQQGGGWNEKVLHSFKGGSTDGIFPEGQLVFDAAGNLYGTTYWGGNVGGCLYGGCGTVFELKHNPDGSWTESILKNFSNNKFGGDLEYGLVFDKAGNLYGTSWVGGANGGGIVFELSPSSGGEWTETILYGFSSGGGQAPPPNWPKGRLIFDAAGNIYGVVEYGSSGCSGGCGAVYELSESAGKWNLTILHSFTGPSSDGAFPLHGLVMDQSGSLYGVTSDGGTGTGTGCNYGCGTVFKMAPTGNGQWTESILYSFLGNNDGQDPDTELTFDAAGNLYGATYAGGGLGTCTDGGCGTVFELSPSGSQWNETLLWKFDGTTDGANPSSGLFLSSSGQLYGETYSGSNSGQNGTVYSLTPSSGTWSLASLSTFVNTDGEFPTAGLVADNAGNLYGTTASGGSAGLGTVFELSPVSGGGWSEKIIYNFTTGNIHYYYIPSGTFPSALIIDSAGNLYGETQNGGQHNAGMVYELSPSPGGGWTEKTLYNFTPGDNGNDPYGSLVMDSAGNLYGTTALGGIGSVHGNSESGNGVVFKLIPGANGVWSETVIYEFAGYPTDGGRPEAGLFMDKSGNLYGTTLRGGTGGCVGTNDEIVGCGTVFELAFQAGVWKETSLYAFQDTGNDGLYPSASPVVDGAGHIFGTTLRGGSGNSRCTSCGTAFEIVQNTRGWNERRIFNFPGPDQSANPASNLILDAERNLYGTTPGKVTGCGFGDCGTAFELTPSSGGAYTYESLYSFTDVAPDGGAPQAGLIFGPSGSLLGTTENGGNANEGAVFAITP